MSKKVVLVAGVLLAAGAAAAISAPSLFDDLADGVGHATQRVSQAIGVSDEEAAPAREQRRSRRAKQRRGDEERADEAQSAEHVDAGKPSREVGGKGQRGNDRLARQEDEDGEGASDAGARRERRWAEQDRGEQDDEGRGARRQAAFAAQDRHGQSFGRVDKNGDGAIDMNEFVLAETERIAARTRAFFKRFDSDGDGKVSRDEFGRGARERFTPVDADDAVEASQRRAAAVK
ncbi:MAG: EF-hand domain-containing protein [Hyphomicrobiaceae bacterium]